MRNVLIPTDFSVDSLALVERTVKALGGQPVNVILFHAFERPYTSEDGLGSSKRLPYADVLTEDFRSACKRLKTTHAKVIQQIHIRHMYGSTLPVFRNFIDANDVDTIICPDDYVYTSICPQSVNPLRLFRKCGIPVMSLVERRTTFVQDQAPLSEVVAVLTN